MRQSLPIFARVETIDGEYSDPCANIVAIRRVLTDMLGHFNDDDGWSMASHLAITALMALFPFLIFATTLASFLGAQAFTETAVHLVFDTWPDQIADPIAREVVNVLTVQRTDLLTYGVLLAAFFASNGIEALRTSLNRAYRVTETRTFVFRRIQSIAFVLIATVGFLAISVLLVLAPLIARFAVAHAAWIEPYIGTFTLWRFVIASTVIVLGLFAVHVWLPAGKRRFVDIVPGIIFTLARLAGRIDDLRRLSRPFLLLCEHLCRAGLDHDRHGVPLHRFGRFILGGELNASIRRYLDARARLGVTGINVSHRDTCTCCVYHDVIH